MQTPHRADPVSFTPGNVHVQPCPCDTTSRDRLADSQEHTHVELASASREKALRSRCFKLPRDPSPGIGQGCLHRRLCATCFTQLLQCTLPSEETTYCTCFAVVSIQGLPAPPLRCQCCLIVTPSSLTSSPNVFPRSMLTQPHDDWLPHVPPSSNEELREGLKEVWGERERGLESKGMSGDAVGPRERAPVTAQWHA